MISTIARAETACPFDTTKNSYRGTPLVQATCLLRQVNRFGKLSPERTLPETIASKVANETIEITAQALQKYLSAKGIAEADVGGAIKTPLDKKTRYFIIHDTSTPNYKGSQIPNNINDTTWTWNNLSKYPSKAHIYINRLGESKTSVDLSENYRTTKFELLDNNRKNLYVGIELVQPRRSYPEGSKKNDALAPVPGFTITQLERLAVVYFVASVRAGKYLIPAYHSVIDAGLKDGHDDPQNFDLKAWDDVLSKIFLNIRDYADTP